MGGPPKKNHSPWKKIMFGQKNKVPLSLSLRSNDTACPVTKLAPRMGSTRIAARGLVGPIWEGGGVQTPEDLRSTFSFCVHMITVYCPTL